jgi:hypothetical protein
MRARIGRFLGTQYILMALIAAMGFLVVLIMTNLTLIRRIQDLNEKLDRQERLYELRDGLRVD